MYVLIYVCRSDIRTYMYVCIRIYIYVRCSHNIILRYVYVFCVFLVTQCILRLIPGNHSMIHLMMVASFYRLSQPLRPWVVAMAQCFNYHFGMYIRTYNYLVHTYIRTYMCTCIHACYMHTTYLHKHAGVCTYAVCTYERTYLCRYNIVHT